MNSTSVNLAGWVGGWVLSVVPVGLAFVPSVSVRAQAPAVAPAQPAAQPAAHPAQQPPPQDLLGPPPVQFEPATLDLGVIRPNGHVDATVMIHNISDRWLVIKASKASCTCTAVNLANTSIAPGQAVPMDVSYHAASVTGDKKASVKVLFEGYDVIEVPIVANVAMPIRSEPAYIDALQHEGGQQTLSGEFKVFAADHKPFKVMSVNGKEPAYVDFNPKTDTPRDAYTLKWDLTGYDAGTCKNAAGERMPISIVVETDRPDSPMIDLEIRNMCNMRSPPTPMDNWAIQDKRVLLGTMKPGESAEVEVEVKWIPRREKIGPPHIVVSESPMFTVELLGTSPLEGGLVLKLKYTMANDAKGYVYGLSRVYSNRQQAPLIVIARATE